MQTAPPPRVELHPGFPLPAADYDALLRALSHSGPLRIAHSLGALTVVAQGGDVPTVLLAPSVPGRRRDRALAHLVIGFAERTPFRVVLARRLCSATYRRYGAAPPPGGPLPLRTAAARLADAIRAERAAPAPLGHVVVIASTADDRHPAQVAFAARSGQRSSWSRADTCSR